MIYYEKINALTTPKYVLKLNEVWKRQSFFNGLKLWEEVALLLPNHCVQKQKHFQFFHERQIQDLSKWWIAKTAGNHLAQLNT